MKELEQKLSTVNCQLLTRQPKVAVMGCVVNGPGEAREADVGIAFGKKEGLLFRDGKPVRKVPFINCAGVLLKEVEKTNGSERKNKADFSFSA